MRPERPATTNNVDLGDVRNFDHQVRNASLGKADSALWRVGLDSVGSRPNVGDLLEVDLRLA